MEPINRLQWIKKSLHAKLRTPLPSMKRNYNFIYIYDPCLDLMCECSFAAYEWFDWHMHVQWSTESSMHSHGR